MRALPLIPQYSRPTDFEEGNIALGRRTVNRGWNCSTPTKQFCWKVSKKKWRSFFHETEYYRTRERQEKIYLGALISKKEDSEKEFNQLIGTVK